VLYIDTTHFFSVAQTLRTLELVVFAQRDELFFLAFVADCISESLALVSESESGVGGFGIRSEPPILRFL
jgi:hypothetical protein